MATWWQGPKVSLLTVDVYCVTSISLSCIDHVKQDTGWPNPFLSRRVKIKSYDITQSGRYMSTKYRETKCPSYRLCHFPPSATTADDDALLRTLFQVTGILHVTKPRKRASNATH